MTAALLYAFGAVLAAGVAGAALGHAFFKMLESLPLGQQADDDEEGE